jgi:hypothetical protein
MTRKALALCALLAAACGDLDEVQITRSATLDPIPAGQPEPTVTLPIAVPLPIDRRALREEGIDPNDVDSARLVALRIEVVQGASFEDWLESVVVHIGAAGPGRQVLAQRSGIKSLPDGSSVVDLQASGVDLKPYILADTSIVTADLTGNAPAADTTVKVTATLRVDVNVGGLFD